VAVFGEKDWQQLIIIRRMVPLIWICRSKSSAFPRCAKPIGLAMSSRNGYLSAEERAIAPTLYATLQASGGTMAGRRSGVYRAGKCRQGATGGGRIPPDYVEIRRADDLQRPEGNDAEVRIFAAAWLGRARLIDNLAIT
jgi:pantoate--beta-alanine ligase